MAGETYRKVGTRDEHTEIRKFTAESKRHLDVVFGDFIYTLLGDYKSGWRVVWVSGTDWTPYQINVTLRKNDEWREYILEWDE